MVIKGNKYFKYGTKSGFLGDVSLRANQHERFQPPNDHARNGAAIKPVRGEKVKPRDQKANAAIPNTHTSNKQFNATELRRKHMSTEAKCPVHHSTSSG